MTGVLWGVQIMLTVVFSIAGTIKLVRSKEQLAPKMAWVEDYSAGTIRAIGGTELLGAAGLALPELLDTLVWAMPLAAACLAVLMLGATWTHVRRKEQAHALVPLGLALVSGFLAYGRFTAS